MKMFVKSVLCATVLATVATPTMAEDFAYKDQIEARQGYFQVVKFNMGILGEMAKGKRDYDADLAQAIANNLKNAGTMDNSLMWPKGSDMDAEGLSGHTKAKAAIWQADSEIGEKFGDFAAATETMAANAGQGLDALRDAIGPLGKSCKSCHTDYRAK
ncbi:cytochrome c [Amphritea sp. 2_MG-2023]|jgi:cytochrome c556|uniref:c-type cytochrome n=1 Tax=Amphritea TaxID=515417 RepID=UPI001C070F7D|nr:MULTISPECIES: cytochrome c [Amphritea]MBU2964255.1 cytochrome c [Amphritea atlantica]MDO6419488.1 cytochrome c [Amphritea sp. 2_MG-2023]MDX2422379.1 cytochrome c [Amphritea sp.]